MTGTEIPLDGGNISSGVVRAGDTVRRPARSHGPATSARCAATAWAGSVRTPAEMGLLMR
jgi:hypothetical protein